MSDCDLYQAIFDALSPHITVRRIERMRSVLDHRVSSVRLVFDQLFDPHNGAACVRTADAMGIFRIDAIEGEIPFDLSNRVTGGSHRWASLTRFTSAERCVTALKAEGFRLLGADLNETAVPIDAVDFAGPVAIVFGNEQQGISPAMRASLDTAFVLPMLGFCQSFNLSVACAVTLMHMRQQGCLLPDLTDAEKLRLSARWLRRDVPGAEVILGRHGITAPLNI